MALECPVISHPPFPTMKSYLARFSGLERLFGTAGLERLHQAHVCVVGLGGVGSWAVEALARSGIGKLTLIDLDDICISNVNRQLHALNGALGKPKVEVIADRILAINPDCVLHPVHAFFTRANAHQILSARFDYVVDAIDSPSKKCLLIAGCRERGIPVIATGASAGRRDPLAVRVADLASTSHDRLLQEVRKKLRVRDGFPREGQPFNVSCVFSSEPPVFPACHGRIADRPDPSLNLRLDCGAGLGTASFVTGTFGFVAASHVVRTISGGGGAR